MPKFVNNLRMIKSRKGSPDRVVVRRSSDTRSSRRDLGGHLRRRPGPAFSNHRQCPRAGSGRCGE
jgi:hypothetical protein